MRKTPMEQRRLDKPGEAQGFRDPKSGGKWVREPNGPRYGWLHSDGSVWVPTGHRSIAHGSPHWDAQNPDGTYKNVKPPKNDRR